MVITSLDQMESIVKNNSSLSWFGWDVVELKRSPRAWMDPRGAFVKGSWYVKTVFPITQDGWSIPPQYKG